VFLADRVVAVFLVSGRAGRAASEIIGWMRPASASSPRSGHRNSAAAQPRSMSCCTRNPQGGRAGLHGGVRIHERRGRTVRDKIASRRGADRLRRRLIRALLSEPLLGHHRILLPNPVNVGSELKDVISRAEFLPDLAAVTLTDLAIASPSHLSRCVTVGYLITAFRPTYKVFEPSRRLLSVPIILFLFRRFYVLFLLARPDRRSRSAPASSSFRSCSHHCGSSATSRRSHRAARSWAPPTSRCSLRCCRPPYPWILTGPCASGSPWRCLSISARDYRVLEGLGQLASCICPRRCRRRRMFCLSRLRGGDRCPRFNSVFVRSNRRPAR